MCGTTGEEGIAAKESELAACEAALEMQRKEHAEAMAGAQAGAAKQYAHKWQARALRRKVCGDMARGFGSWEAYVAERAHTLSHSAAAVAQTSQQLACALFSHRSV